MCAYVYDADNFCFITPSYAHTSMPRIHKHTVEKELVLTSANSEKKKLAMTDDVKCHKLTVHLLGLRAGSQLMLIYSARMLQ